VKLLYADKNDKRGKICMKTNKLIKKWKWTLLLGGVLTAAALLWGCLNPASIGAPDGNSDFSEPGTGEAEGDFTVTLRVAGSGGEGDSRAIVGPQSGAIRYGQIRNIVQVIVVDIDGQLVDFQQAVRNNDTETSTTVYVRNLWPGRKYHFLVLTGHKDRNYSEEILGGNYSFKSGSPTLLAAGFLPNWDRGDQDTVTITMRPLTVDTRFTYMAGEVLNNNHAKLPSAGGNVLPPGAGDPKVVWQLVGGGGSDLLAAHQIKSSEINNWGGLFPTKIIRFGDTYTTSSTNMVDDKLSLDLGSSDNGTESIVAFNLTGYVPFGFPSMDTFLDFDQWVVRNGVNDDEQNENTVFPKPETKLDTSIWGATGSNGNGAIVVKFKTEPVGVEAAYTDTFAGAVNEITKAIAAQHSSAEFTLVSGTEKVSFGTGHLDEAGLVLTATTPTTPIIVELNGGGREIQLTNVPSKNNAPLITVGQEVTLILRNITFRGVANNEAPLIKVEDGGTLELEDGACITGNTNTSFNGKGGGVFVTGASSTFNMKGGIISLNTANGHGGGVAVQDATFTMSGNALVSYNSGTNGGGVYVTDASSTFNMKGGTISHNIAKYQGGGVAVQDATFTMSGGKISNNTGAFYGGGVIVGEKSKLNISGNAEILNNEALFSGGGIYILDEGEVTMSGNVKISGNKALAGGGVAAVSNAKFTMQDGMISGNQAIGELGDDYPFTIPNVGGGVAVDGDSIFEYKGGTIYGSYAEVGTANTAADGGAAVYKGANGIVKLNGNPQEPGEEWKWEETITTIP
jgi:hypothetical protein